MIVVDASVLIAHLDERDALHTRASDALLAAADRRLGCSPITLAEVLVGPARRDRLDAARAAVAELDVEEIPLGEDAAVRLAALRAGSGLKLPDCGVLLAAQDAAAEAVLTFDDALGREVERLGLRAADAACPLNDEAGPALVADLRSALLGSPSTDEVSVNERVSCLLQRSTIWRRSAATRLGAAAQRRANGAEVAMFARPGARAGVRSW